MLFMVLCPDFLEIRDFSIAIGCIEDKLQYENWVMVVHKKNVQDLSLTISEIF